MGDWRRARFTLCVTVYGATIGAATILVNLLTLEGGLGRMCLVTDAIRAAGMDDGRYSLGGLEVNVAAGVARLTDGTLAGSTLTMEEALRNVIEYTGLPLTEALALATANPARTLGLSQRKGVLVEGADADLVLLDSHSHVRATMRMGAVVFER